MAKFLLNILFPLNYIRSSALSIALNFCVVCSLHCGGVVERWRIFHHNVGGLENVFNAY